MGPIDRPAAPHSKMVPGGADKERACQGTDYFAHI